MEQPVQSEPPEWVQLALLEWEKMRLLYNLILLPWGVILIMAGWRDLAGHLSLWQVLSGSLGMGLAANLAYFLGPLGELYLTALLRRRWHRWARRVAFIAGLLISGVVLTGTIVVINLGLVGFG